MHRKLLGPSQNKTRWTFFLQYRLFIGGYLRDFVQAINAADHQAILDLREHRNNLAHELPSHLLKSDFGTNQDLLGAAHKAIFKISNYQAYVDIGSDPAFKGIDWSTESPRQL